MGASTPSFWLSAGPLGPAEVCPGTAFRITLGMQALRTRVFRSVELKDHPLRIRNARIRRRVEESGVVLRELKFYGTDVVLQLLGLAGCDDHAANGRPSQHPRERHTGWASVMPCGHFLQRVHDAVAQNLFERHERPCLRKA